MGNNEERIRINNEHIEELERIRNLSNLKEKELLLKEKIEQYGLEKHKSEIEALINLDRYHFEVEMKRIQMQQKKDEKMHKLKQKINDFLYNQKALSNDKLSVNFLNTEETIKEKNRYGNGNSRKMGDFEVRSSLNRYHHLNIENIRKQYDLKEKELLIEQKILELDLEKNKLEMERLELLNRYNYEAKLKLIQNQFKINEQLHQIELKIINDTFLSNLKSLANKEHEINKIYEENLEKEKIRNDNENKKIQLIYEKIALKNKNSLLEKLEKKEKEAEIDRKNYENYKKKIQLNFKKKLEEIKMERKKNEEKF